MIKNRNCDWSPAFQMPIGTSDPTLGLSEGMFYYKTDSNTLRYYDGSIWNDVSNIISNINADDFDPVTADAGNYGPVFVISQDISNALSTSIYSANAPFKIRILDAWVVETAVNTGNWQITDGTNAITTSIAYAGVDTSLTRAGAIDDAYHEIAASGSLAAVNTVATDDAILYVLAQRID